MRALRFFSYVGCFLLNFCPFIYAGNVSLKKDVQQDFFAEIFSHMDIELGQIEKENNQQLVEFKEQINNFKKSYYDGNAREFNTDRLNEIINGSLCADNEEIKYCLQSLVGDIDLIKKLLSNDLENERYRLEVFLKNYKTNEENEQELLLFCKQAVEKYPVLRLKLYQLLVSQDLFQTLKNKLEGMGIYYIIEEMNKVNLSMRNSMMFSGSKFIPNSSAYAFYITQLSSVLPYCDNNTLVVLDIDDTLVADKEDSTQVVGGQNTLDTLGQMKTKFALTMRSYSTLNPDYTFNQLSELGITLNQLKEDFPIDIHGYYHKGIFYSPIRGYNFKGLLFVHQALPKLLKEFENKVKRVVYVDDTPWQVTFLVQLMKRMHPNIEVLGFVRLPE